MYGSGRLKEARGRGRCVVGRRKFYAGQAKEGIVTRNTAKGGKRLPAGSVLLVAVAVSAAGDVPSCCYSLISQFISRI